VGTIETGCEGQIASIQREGDVVTQLGRCIDREVVRAG
jgi:hypothetical protein